MKELINQYNYTPISVLAASRENKSFSVKYEDLIGLMG
jgi:hypothetical protein